MESSKLPEIKPIVQKEEDENKKPGFFARLFSGGGAGAGGAGELGGGLGAGGGFGGLGGAGVAGGLLATKAGLIGLILIGTTVAGGLGFVGFKAFGPGAADRQGGPMQLFAPRPAETHKDSTSDAPNNGNSRSLDYFASANQLPSEPLGEPAKVDGSVSDQNAAAAAAATVGNGQSINANVGGNKAASLKTDKKFGELSKMGGTAGGGSGSSGASMPSNSLLALAKPANNGLSTGRGSKAAAGNMRGLTGRRLGGGNSMRQLGQVRQDQNRAASSRAAGTTYDGAKSGMVGADAGVPAAGAGAADGTPPRANPTNGSDSAERFPPTPGATGKNVTPWQGAINTAMMCIAGAALLLMAAAKIAKVPAKGDVTGQSKMVAKILCGIAAILSLVAITMGSMMAGGQYGQKMQGGMFMLSGGAMLAATAVTWMGVDKGFAGGTPTAWMYLSGGAALAVALAGYMTKPMKVDESFFKDGRAPDWNNSNYKAPSQDALNRFLV